MLTTGRNIKGEKYRIRNIFFTSPILPIKKNKKVANNKYSHPPNDREKSSTPSTELIPKGNNNSGAKKGKNNSPLKKKLNFMGNIKPSSQSIGIGSENGKFGRIGGNGFRGSLGTGFG
ncbi:hypothetical protein YWS52_32810 [Chitiniphilus shinanonensis]